MKSNSKQRDLKRRCINSNIPISGDKIWGGAGWSEGYEFNVASITDTSVPIYWHNKGGVYETWLELATPLTREQERDREIKIEISKLKESYGG